MDGTMSTASPILPPPKSSNGLDSSRETLVLWATISHILWWTVLAVSIASVPVLCHALWLMIRRYRKSNYYHFLTSMIVLDLLMLISILFNLVWDDLDLKGESLASSALARGPIGSYMCKLTAFVTNITACYINWLWVVMFAQRFVHIFFPMHCVKSESAFFRYVSDTRKLIFLTGVMSIVTTVGSLLVTYTNSSD